MKKTKFDPCSAWQEERQPQTETGQGVLQDLVKAPGNLV